MASEHPESAPGTVTKNVAQEFDQDQSSSSTDPKPIKRKLSAPDVLLLHPHHTLPTKFSATSPSARQLYALTLASACLTFHAHKQLVKKLRTITDKPFSVFPPTPALSPTEAVDYLLYGPGGQPPQVLSLSSSGSGMSLHADDGPTIKARWRRLVAMPEANFKAMWASCVSNHPILVKKLLAKFCTMYSLDLGINGETHATWGLFTKLSLKKLDHQFLPSPVIKTELNTLPLFGLTEWLSSYNGGNWLLASYRQGGQILVYKRKKTPQSKLNPTSTPEDDSQLVLRLKRKGERTEDVLQEQQLVSSMWSWRSIYTHEGEGLMEEDAESECMRHIIRSEVPTCVGVFRFKDIPKDIAYCIDDRKVCVVREEIAGEEEQPSTPVKSSPEVAGPGSRYQKKVKDGTTKRRISIEVEAAVYICSEHSNVKLDDIRYVKEADEVRKGSVKALHDLFMLARRGYIVPEISELFACTPAPVHQFAPRIAPDPYVWAPELFNPTAACQMKGSATIANWRSHVEPSRFKITGLSFMGPFCKLTDITNSLSTTQPNSSDTSEDEGQTFGEQVHRWAKHLQGLRDPRHNYPTASIPSIVLSTFLGEYLYAWVFTVMSWYEQKYYLSKKKKADEFVHDLERILLDGFAAAFTAFARCDMARHSTHDNCGHCITPQNREANAERERIEGEEESGHTKQCRALLEHCVDWHQLARQLLFFISGQYVHTVDNYHNMKKIMPAPDLYGATDTCIGGLKHRVPLIRVRHLRQFEDEDDYDIDPGVLLALQEAERLRLEMEKVREKRQKKVSQALGIISNSAASSTSQADEPAMQVGSYGRENSEGEETLGTLALKLKSMYEELSSCDKGTEEGVEDSASDSDDESTSGSTSGTSSASSSGSSSDSDSDTDTTVSMSSSAPEPVTMTQSLFSYLTPASVAKQQQQQLAEKKAGAAGGATKEDEWDSENGWGGKNLGAPNGQMPIKALEQTVHAVVSLLLLSCAPRTCHSSNSSNSSTPTSSPYGSLI